MNIEKYIISECHVYTPFEIQEGYHKADQNLGSTIKVDYDALPDHMKEDEALVAVAISQWYHSTEPTPRPAWIVD